MTIQLRYESLTLRPLAVSDSSLIFAWRNDANVRKAMFSGDLIEISQHEAWLSRTLGDPSCAYFIFEIAERPAGLVGFSEMGDRDLRARWTFHVRPDLRIPGAGTAMGFLAVDRAFRELGRHKLCGEVLADNERSLRMHRRLGFRREGIRTAHVHKAGTWMDVHEYALLAEEWAGIRGAIHEALFSEFQRPKPKVLFTGGGGSASQSLQEQWSERYELYFADANPEAFPPGIPQSRRCVIPLARDPAFTETVAALCKRERIDLIVPGVDEELLAFARMHGAPGWPRIMLPETKFIEQMLDKLVSAQAIEAAGLDVPMTRPLERASEVGFPLIAKPRTGRGSRGVMRLDRPEQVAAYLALQAGKPEDFIAQQLVLGDEYTVCVAADGGILPREVIPVRAMEKRGITLRAKTDRATSVIEYAKAFQAHFRASGCYNIQCMLTPDGKVLPFEVNPRISTTFVLAIATGFDPIPMALGGEIEMGKFERHAEWSLHRSWFSAITKTR
ncbi:UDP-4-amino-4,6-dideoxy-N-acetyl-beta-L-altrosamine N-acetyltransferase [Bordetella genomosp. 13]|uniref:UDP-4-amino-4, 6-dideoxy-N-acetyl-beta-L-altrosamine N-acetyltransferase n=1 Tax=Bordetella genomosp. 13 TaxID=463040 RepID=A0A1W6Z9M9_9BORD|nr:UDP-4-amino-4,6-dideoxy-N-acetyl-beta-L-altrosamine N-acetyltransferase [Bordetella genomosp. 13]ARP94071.1 UDP-4-amino-4,6-dideoxy-N-acetyl-beta-L-altrosamine N-acetyltransferase [Bordetella genomosp. 13]